MEMKKKEHWLDFQSRWARKALLDWDGTCRYSALLKIRA